MAFNPVQCQVAIVANQPQAFRQHHLTRALKAAAAAGTRNPTVTVTLPTGATITIGSGKPDAGKASRPSARSPHKRGKA
jgi:hypothetical protein